jgi:hypothetical protein
LFDRHAHAEARAMIGGWGLSAAGAAAVCGRWEALFPPPRGAFARPFPLALLDRAALEAALGAPLLVAD